MPSVQIGIATASMDGIQVPISSRGVRLNRAFHTVTVSPNFGPDFNIATGAEETVTIDGLSDFHDKHFPGCARIFHNLEITTPQSTLGVQGKKTYAVECPVNDEAKDIETRGFSSCTYDGAYAGKLMFSACGTMLMCPMAGDLHGPGKCEQGSHTFIFKKKALRTGYTIDLIAICYCPDENGCFEINQPATTMVSKMRKA